MSGATSYGQILRSSSIMGGSLGASYLVGLLRVKAVAVLLGPSGVGLLSTYTSAVGLIGMVSSLGIGGSAVLEVAQAHARDDPVAASRAAKILRRACWLTGAIGWLLALLLAGALSRLMFESPDHAIAIALLGATLLLGALASGQTAILQGTRRIGDMARANVIGMLFNTALSIGLYAIFGADGIVPALIASAGVTLTVSWWFARKVDMAPVAVGWMETLSGAKRLAGLGFAFMWAGLLGAGLDTFTRSIITRELGLEAAGIYQSAWAVSGLFAGFILSAMGADFYPRLAGAIHDHALAVRTVNEQVEIGILLALPGLLATLAFAQWIIEVFYTRQFLPAAGLLPWFVLGVFGRVLSWPLAYIQITKGAGRLYAATETVFTLLQVGLLLVLIPAYGVAGAAYTFALAYLFYTIAVVLIGKVLVGFVWSAGVKRLLFLASTMILAGFAAKMLLHDGAALAVGGLMTVLGSAFSLRGLSSRVGPEHRLIRIVNRVPGGKWVLGL